jgi:exodeoxyribonuclease VII small subunit
MARKKKTEDTSFEDLITTAEAAVEALESGELSLEESMARYEEGVTNLKECAKRIQQAQARVEQLIEEQDGALKLEPFEDEEGILEDADTDEGEDED